MVYRGEGISTGKVIAKVVWIKDAPILINQVVKNQQRERESLEQSLKDLSTYYTNLLDGTSNKDVVDLIAFYKLLLSSQSLLKELEENIQQGVSAVSAVEKVFNEKAEELKNMDNEYMRARSSDMADVKVKLQKLILKIEDMDFSAIEEDYILVAKEMTPSMILSANKKHLKGIISEEGSMNSHVAILARSLDIPAVFGIKNSETILENNELIYLDGQGFIQTELNEEERKEIKMAILKEQHLKEMLQSLRKEKVKTMDGFELEIAANVGHFDDLNSLKELDVDGIGLFRTEFLFLDRGQLPTEEEQFQIYRKYAEHDKEKKVIIRTLDVGGDKNIPYLHIEEESNSFLGLRGIRYCLKHKEIFKTQLRAILRSSVYGNVMIMYPMIGSIEEIRKANIILREAMNELDLEDVVYNKDCKVGIMIETPAAVLQVDNMINEVDFFSIGTNDLIQYTEAVDRTNAEVRDVYDPFSPAIIRSIKTTIDAKKQTKFVGLCGELGANPFFLILLIAMNIDEVSVGIQSVVKVKKYVSMLKHEDCKKVLEHVLTLRTGTEIKEYLTNFAKDVYQEYLHI